MTRNYFFSTFYLLFLLARIANAQDIQFNHLTTENGLSTNNIFAIVQDYQGFIWIGTVNGLHRYDGYEFKIYTREEQDTFSLKGNTITNLIEDANKNLWVGTFDGGLSLYDRKNDRFFNYENNPNDSNSISGNIITGLFEDENNNLWISTQQGGLSNIELNHFDPYYPIFNNIVLPEIPGRLGDYWLSSFEFAENGNIWLGLHGAGVLEFDPAKGIFFNHFTEKGYGKLFENRIFCLYKDSKKRLWIGASGGGLQMFDEKTKSLHYYQAGENPGSLPNNQIESLLEDINGNFWIGTDNGLARLLDFNEAIPAGNFKTYQHDDFSPMSLLSNAIKPIYQDNNNRLWISSFFEGMNIYDKKLLSFYTVSANPTIKNSLQDNTITQIKEDEHGDFWIGSENEGLSILPKGDENLFKTLYRKVKLRNSITGNLETKIKCIEFDMAGDTWVGTWGGGMFCINIKSKKVQHFPYEPLSGLPSQSVFSIKADSNNNIWIGTFGGGLARLDKSTKFFSYFTHDPSDSTTISHNTIRTIFIDKAGSVWVGTNGNGLNLYNPRKNNFQRIHNEYLTPQIFVSTIFEDSNGYLWIGTRSHGLIKYKHETGSCEGFSKKHGLPNNSVQAITEDKQKNIWISTDVGISKLEKDGLIFTNYSSVEGIQSTRFNPKSVLSSDDGKIIFGGNRGLSVFYPSQISEKIEEQNLVFTGLWINNKEVGMHDTGTPLKENIITTEELQLNNHQNSFSVEFAALKYNFSFKTKYAYQLEGFQDEWQNIGRERKATFTNLEPGEYQLHIKAIDRDGHVGENYKTLKIYIRPAWYQTIIFRISFVLLILALAFTFHGIRIRYLKKQRQLLKQKVDERTNELYEKNNEIQTQNEELTSQNEQISNQRDQLEIAHTDIKNINENLEQVVEDRTKKLKDTVKKLHKTVTELDRFVYSASHDLSAPLKSILGLVYVAQIEKDKTRIPEYLDHIELSIIKLEEVIRNLVLYSRNNRIEVKAEKINVLALTRSVIDELMFIPNAKRIKINLGIVADVAINTDQQRLKVVLHNLINNAIKYTDSEKENPTIHISCSTTQKECHIIIEDNGIGIEKKDRKKIFNMFYRATEKSKGSGLGLFIVKETVAKLNGKLKLKSKAGLFCKFTLILPI